jgi:hypothetical protein
MSRRSWRSAGILAVSLLAAACSDSPTNPVPPPVAPQPGTLTLRLTTPHADDGALALEVSGPVDSATAAHGSLLLFTRRTGPSTTVGAVVGPLAGGAVVTLHVPDVNAVATYAATVREVADRQDALRASLEGYALVVTK